MTTAASAANDPNCKSNEPPVIVVHGQERPGGKNGRAHVDDSARDIGAFIDGVMRDTGATKVNVVGHSAGTGVLDDWIQLKGGAKKVHRLVSFAGIHRPYAHASFVFEPRTVVPTATNWPAISESPPWSFSSTEG